MGPEAPSRTARDDARWGRLPGAHPPLSPRTPLLAWLVTAVVLIAVIVGVIGGPGPLDDPRQGDQRPGFLIDRHEARVVRGLALPGRPIGRRPVFLAFDRRPAPAGALRAVLDQIPAAYAVVVAVPHPGLPSVAGIPMVVDAGERLAQTVGIGRPKDGGPPIGYAVIDATARVRYVTIDPTWTQHRFEIRLVTRAVT